MPYISYTEFLSEGKNEDMKDASQFDKKFGASFIKSLKFKLNDPSPIDKYIYFSDSTHSKARFWQRYSNFTKEQLQTLLTKIGSGVAQKINELKSASKTEVNEMIVFSRSQNYGLVIDLVPQSNMVTPYLMRIITALPEGKNKTTQVGDKLIMVESESQKEYLYIEID